MNVVFLDIDGVLNNTNDWLLHRSNDLTQIYFISKTNMFYFMETMRKIKDIKIVISSTWRLGGYDKFFERINDIVPEYTHEFKSYLHEDWSTPKKMNSTRGEEIIFWLNNHKGEIEKYLCIDDDSDFRDDQPLLQTHNDYGFGHREKVIMSSYFLGKDTYIRDVLYYLNSLKRILDKQEEFYNKYIKEDNN